MNYFKPTIDGIGIRVPDYVTIRNYLMDEFKRIFGQDLYLGTDTQDYQMISLFATAIDDVNALAIEAYNNRNPEYARGNSLDLILPINGISRLMSTNSTAVLNLVSDIGAMIPAGSVAVDTKGNRWIIQDDVEIEQNDNVDVVARAEVSGRITAGAGHIIFIGTPTAGWISVNNVEEAVPGRNTETDAEVRARRLASVENVAMGILPALVGSLYEIDGVEKVRGYENTTDTTDELGIPSHSICIIVDGGESEKIAQMVYMKKSPGCGLYGGESGAINGETIEIADAFGGTIFIPFLRPIDAPVVVSITMKRFIGYSEEVGTVIKEAVAEYISNHGIGFELETGLLWGVVLAQNAAGIPAVFSPTNIKVSFEGGTLTEDSIMPEFDERISCIASDVTLIYV